MIPDWEYVISGSCATGGPCCHQPGSQWLWSREPWMRKIAHQLRKIAHPAAEGIRP